MLDLKRESMSEQQEKPRYIALDDAAKELGVNRSTLYYYLTQLSIKPEKFLLDRRKYLAIADFERIQAAKRAAEEKQH